MKDNRLLFGALTAIIAVSTMAVTAWWMQSSTQDTAMPDSLPLTVEGSGSLNANPFGKGAFSGPVPALAHAVDTGTGVFRVDGKGELILDNDTKVRLDILLGQLPENATRNELQEIEALATDSLPAPAAQKALRIVEGYTRYLKAEAELNASIGTQNLAQPQEIFSRIVALRRQHLGAQVAEAFFADQEHQERVGIQIAAMDADFKLTAQEKLVRLDELRRSVPQDAPTLHADLDAAHAKLKMEQDIAALRQQGAPEEQVRHLRERHVGAEAAQGIAEMETQKNDWESRQQTFSQQKNAIAQMNLSEPQKQARIETLLSQIYTEEEIPIARAYHQLPVHR